VEESTMQFEVKNALTDLDQRTPAYFLQEIFHHGDLKVREDAKVALREMDPDRKSVRVLREVLRLI
jgi:hypothetical protein